MERDYPVNHDDEDKTTSAVRRTPIEVMRDWWEDRQRMIDHHEDDEDEDDSPEASKKRRIGKALRGLFHKNVEKQPVKEAEEPVKNIERSILGGVVEVADEHTEEVTPEVPEEFLPPVSDGAAHVTVETTEPTATESAPETEEEVPDTVTTSVFAAGSGGAVPPTVVRPSSSDTSDFDPSLITPPTVIEREPVTEEHYHLRGAALASLVVAERIDHHRNKKRKEQIKQVEKSQNRSNKEITERLERVERATPVTEKPVQPVVAERPVVTKAPQPKTETLSATPEKPVVLQETIPKVESRPQSVKEVLDTRRPVSERLMSLDDLQRNRPRPEEQFESEDILATAEKLAARADDTIAHEVYDERWHEIKDKDDAINAAAAPKDTTVVSHEGTAVAFDATASQAAYHSKNRTDISQTPQPQNSPQTAFSGLWAALIVGVIVALMLILMR